MHNLNNLGGRQSMNNHTGSSLSSHKEPKKRKPSKKRGMKKEKPYEGALHIGCLTCSTASRDLKMDRSLSVGFGDVVVTKNGNQVYSEMEFRHANNDPNFDKYPTAQYVEDMAVKEPDEDWRVIFHGPMHGESYQRQDGKWVLIDSNPGFA